MSMLNLQQLASGQRIRRFIPEYRLNMATLHHSRIYHRLLPRSLPRPFFVYSVYLRIEAGKRYHVAYTRHISWTLHSSSCLLRSHIRSLFCALLQTTLDRIYLQKLNCLYDTNHFSAGFPTIQYLSQMFTRVFLAHWPAFRFWLNVSLTHVLPYDKPVRSLPAISSPHYW